MSQERIFVDTSAWLALMLEDDAHHAAADRALSALLKSDTRLITTNHVVGETYTFLARVRNPWIALAFVERIKASLTLDLVVAQEETEAAAYEWLRRYQDQRFSFVDAVSFAVMTEMELQQAFAFDRHFATAGFVTLPMDG